MRLLLIFLLFYLSLLDASQELFKKIESFTLENGMKVYMLDNNKSTLTKIYIRVHTGFQAENESTSGISHLLEHLIFRDTKIGDNDYVHIFKDHGGKHINAYTSTYTTDYFCTIENSKAQWLVQTYKTMLFDKNLSIELFKKEQNIVQTEIGKLKWYSTPFFKYQRLKEKLSPKGEYWHEQNFLFKEEDKRYVYHEQRNNPNFTLNDIMSHYNTYYYPANMELYIAGGFDKQEMKELIVNEYGSINKKGTQTLLEPRNAKLKPKVSNQYSFNTFSKNKAKIGFRYLDSDAKTSMILHAFMLYLKEKIGKEIRAKNGDIYAISTSSIKKHNGTIRYIYFDGLNDAFENNIQKVDKIIDDSIKNISYTDIQEALKLYKTDILTVENSAYEMIKILLNTNRLQSTYKISDKDSYDIFASITPNEFNSTVQKYYTSSNKIEKINREDYLFTKDTYLIFLALFILSVVFYFNIFYRFLPFSKRDYNPRDIIMQRHLSNSFIDFMVALLMLYLALFIFDWIEYFLGILLFGQGEYLTDSLDVPYVYLWLIGAFILKIAIFIGLYRVISYHIKLYITYEGVVLVSSKQNRIISKQEISSLDVVPFMQSSYRKRIGSFFRFYKPLLRLQLKNGEFFYLRSRNAKEALEDIKRRFRCHKEG
jgi:predicted Zn-dependent peptidase